MLHLDKDSLQLGPDRHLVWISRHSRSRTATGLPLQPCLPLQNYSAPTGGSTPPPQILLDKVNSNLHYRYFFFHCGIKFNDVFFLQRQVKIVFAFHSLQYSPRVFTLHHRSRAVPLRSFLSHSRKQVLSQEGFQLSYDLRRLGKREQQLVLIRKHTFLAI